MLARSVPPALRRRILLLTVVLPPPAGIANTGVVSPMLATLGAPNLDLGKRLEVLVDLCQLRDEDSWSRRVKIVVPCEPTAPGKVLKLLHAADVVHDEHGGLVCGLVRWHLPPRFESSAAAAQRADSGQ